jgi:hypothetical protein
VITINKIKNRAKYGNRNGFCNSFGENKCDNVVVDGRWKAKGKR